VIIALLALTVLKGKDASSSEPEWESEIEAHSEPSDSLDQFREEDFAVSGGNEDGQLKALTQACEESSPIQDLFE
jgi:hypothetical protein